MSALAPSKIYHNSKDPGFLGGVLRLLRRARQHHVRGISWQKVKEYVISEQAYTLHMPARRWFTRNHINVTMIDAQWEAHLTEMQGIARQNGGIKYFITLIDEFSRFALTVLVHSKDAKAITTAFDQVFKAAHPRHPRRLQTNKGKKFFNSEFQA